MDIRAITPDYAVSPQIEPGDLTAVKAAGYVTVIDNRPDGEIPPHLHTAEMRKAAEALGLTFVANPVIGGALTMDNVTAQGAAIAGSTGPVFAFTAPKRFTARSPALRPIVAGASKNPRNSIGSVMPWRRARSAIERQSDPRLEKLICFRTAAWEGIGGTCRAATSSAAWSGATDPRQRTGTWTLSQARPLNAGELSQRDDCHPPLPRIFHTLSAAAGCKADWRRNAVKYAG